MSIKIMIDTKNTTMKSTTTTNMNMKNMLLTLLCITSTELYSQNFGSLYPIQIYITKCTFPNPAHKSSN